jgi:microcystin degradation protein MlrC
MRIAVGGLWHETNTFATGLTGLDEFHVLEGQAILAELAGTRTPLGGFLDAAAHRDVEIVPTLFASALPSGLVTRHAHRALAGCLIDRLVDARPDAILLDLHGAMAAEDSDDVEGALLEAARARLGPVPVGVVCDYHANTTARFANLVDVFAGYETYPHVDPYDRGLEIYRLLERLLAREIQPVRAYAQPPLLLPPQVQATAQPPMREILGHARTARHRPGVLGVTVAAGFPYADVPQAGPSVVVTADWDSALAQEVAEGLARTIWHARDHFRLHALPPDDAVAQALARPDGPVILVDSADNVGGGAPGDGTVVLDALLRAGARGAVVAVADPQAVAAARAAGEGARLEVEVGGKTDDRHGAPVRLRARVARLARTEFTYRGSYMTGRRVSGGWTAILDADGVHVIVRERKVMPFDAEELGALDLDARAYRIIVVKSAVAWRAAYGEIARETIEVDTPGVCTANLRSLPYRKVRRPVAPLDSEVSW